MGSQICDLNFSDLNLRLQVFISINRAVRREGRVSLHEAILF